ncbi:hypothetical protein C1Y63_12000 [Corynebacterium sp. 13CS0277]|uniref:DUF6270 domain-containing protein n=1 Tax=Corynebacterium sp. 13CS0277 TaxID=2071994 RepID=UPI000D034B39|nr:DUF6270 domain-containing protein [Corynebacterium sp. 13CS0277]PRQ10340.1 hypothetical protein C1Y63_12000 [Corynebacterium sp. 13CS0277]
MGVFIYGSCVSRDTFEVLRNRPFGDWSLVDYVARQSLISAHTHVPFERLHLENPPASPFQRRMMDSDCAGRVFRAMRGAEQPVDLFLWDLCDERLGVFDFRDGTYSTRSIEYLVAAAPAKQPSGARVIEFGTDEHFELWESKLDFFDEQLAYAQFDNRVLLKVPWASRTRWFRPTPRSMGFSARRANAAFDRYYDAAEARITGLKVIELDSKGLFADSQHRWALAPFHYEHRVYERLCDEIARAL